MPQQQQGAADQQQQGAGEQAAEGGAAAEGGGEAEGGSGWAGSPLHKKTDARLTALIDKLGRTTPQMRCRPSFTMSVAQMAPAVLGEDGGLVSAAALHLPCK